MTKPTTVGIHFRSEAAPAGAFTVLGLRGEEALSRPYRFEIDLASPDPALPLDDIAGAAGELDLAGRAIPGVVAEVEQGGALGPGRYAYRVALVPRLALLGLARQTRIYQRLSVPDLVEAVIAESGLAIEVERRLERAYPPREHAVQYQESALDFVSRQLEQAGISYVIEPRGGAERLVLCDHPGGFRGAVEASMGEREAAQVRALRCRRRLSPRALVLLDYNERTPEVPLQAEAEVDGRGFGLLIDEGGPFATPEEGAALAVARAEELRCRAAVYDGAIGAPLAAGARLGLSGHFRADWNRDYLVTRAVHRAEAGDGPRYACEFEAIPASTRYRPPRITPRPRLEGAMVAHVDARGPEGTAAVDAEGRYRVVMPFDLSGAAEAQASVPMRLATPYGGEDEGMHFTLRKGAEVLWTGVGGDPERPVITGVVPNAKSRVVTSADEGRGRIRMPNGAMVEMGGGFGRRRARGASGPPAASRGGTGGAPAASQAGTDAAPAASQAGTGGALPLEQQLGQDDITTTASAAEDWIRIAVPHSDGKYSYLRYGERASAPAGSFTESARLDPADGFGDSGWTWSSLDTGYDISSADGDKGSAAHFGWAASDGVYDHTDGNRTVVTQGDYQSVTTGNRTDVVLGNYRLVIPNRTLGIYDADFYSMTFSNDWQGWRKTQRSHVSSVNLTYGDNSSFFTGINFGMSLGGNYSIAAGVNGNVFLGLNTGITAGMVCNIAYGPVLEFGNTKKLTTADEQDIKARSRVHLRVRATDKPAIEAAKPWVAAVAAGAAGAVFGAGGAAAGKDDLDKGGGLTGMTWGIATLGALVGSYLVHKLAHANPLNDAELIIEPTQILLRCGGPAGATIKIEPAAIELTCGTSSLKVDAAAGVVAQSGPAVLELSGSNAASTLKFGGSQVQVDAVGALIKGQQLQFF
ncbi:type VI secretion system Vgr family protein [Sorangium sp. So ce1335]|uniref:type VI secretion system Vgr family protein n=1 Tax=Sorangium sp. So ce1335 TaxID=3133335 RepID=UPI003F61DB6B